MRIKNPRSDNKDPKRLAFAYLTGMGNFVFFPIFVYLDFLPVVLQFWEKITGSLATAPGHLNAANHGMDTFIKLGLRLKNGMGGLKAALDSKLAEHLYFLERKSRFFAFRKKQHPASLSFLLGAGNNQINHPQDNYQKKQYRQNPTSWVQL